MIVSTKVVDLMEDEDALPGHSIAYTRQDSCKLFDQVWPIPGLFQLLDHTNHDIVTDALCVDFVVC